MATSKSKTIRANPLDAISAVSIEKVKEPISSIESIKPKRTRKKRSITGKNAETELPQDHSLNVNEHDTSSKQLKSGVFEKKKDVSTAEVEISSSSESPTQASETYSSHKKCADDIFIQELSAPDKDAPKDLPKNNTHSGMATTGLPPEAFSEIKNQEARAIIKSWAQWSAVGGMVPAPLVDTLLISAAQIKMIHALCKCYGVPFQKKLAIAVASGLVGGGLTTTTAQFVGRSVIKSVPLLGAVLSIAIEPTLSYASSYAIGMTFVKHFESNGTLSNFNARDMKEYCSEQIHRCQAYLKDRKTSIFSAKEAH